VGRASVVVHRCWVVAPRVRPGPVGRPRLAVTTAVSGHWGLGAAARRFARVVLDPGQTETVGFRAPISLLAYTDRTGDVVMEPGPVELAAGTSSDDLRSTTTLTVTGQARVFNGEDRAYLSTATVGT
jgi:hypothetical protein